ncbi:MAG: lysine--tRNA ligase [Candidatus Moranbacteria bacterium]|nr:lysine--tRNA ligase [Candidatus Moranbacteria bacterium]
MREDIVAAKADKLEKLITVFGTAYPEKTERTHTTKEVFEAFDSLSESGTEVVVAGRIRSMRTMGKIAFAHLEDGSGRIQIFLSDADLGAEVFGLFSDTVEMGDFVSVRGMLFVTKKGEKTVSAKSWTILSKSMRPIPTDHFGIEDKEELLRRRYLDLLSNSETRELFRKKNLFWQTIRRFYENEGYLEVQTPVLEHVPGGAEAEPFITHHNALDTDFYMRISLELSLKRLLVGGYERVFEIGRVFRNEGIDRDHLQEFDHMECYGAYLDLEQGMKMTERLYKEIVSALTDGSMKTTYEGMELDWSKPFPRVDYFTEFEKETGIDLSAEVTVDTLRAKGDELGIKYDPTAGKGRLIDTIYKKTVRQKLIQPCFLVGHPIEVSPLAKSDPTNPNRVLRMQPVAAKSELGNGFAELNDPADQRRRFEDQMKLREAGDAEGMMLDEDFLEALEYGMPPAFGFGMSERLFAVLMDRSIRETVIFPPMRNRER